MRQASSDFPRIVAISGNDSSSNVRSRITCRCGSLSDSSARSSALGLLVEDQPRQRGTRAGREPVVIGDVVFTLDVTLLPAVKVGAIADLVLRDPHHPAQERAAVGPLEVVEALERLEEASPAGCRGTRAARAGRGPS